MKTVKQIIEELRDYPEDAVVYAIDHNIHRGLMVVERNGDGTINSDLVSAPYERITAEPK